MTLGELYLRLAKGEHELSGIDKGQLPAASRYDEDANCMVFVLDGTGYCAVEDANDGYRSSLRELSLMPADLVRNRFVPVLVTARMRDSRSAHEDAPPEVLELLDAANGQVVLAVGTDNSDSYYPAFVAEWTPGNLSANLAVPAVAFTPRLHKRHVQPELRGRGIALDGQLVVETKEEEDQ